MEQSVLNEIRPADNQPATKGDVRHLEADIKTQLRALDADTKSQLRELNGRIGKLEGRMDGLETQMSDLRGDVREIRSMLSVRHMAMNNAVLGVAAILGVLLSGMVGAVLF